MLLQENYFGDDQKFCDFETSIQPLSSKKSSFGDPVSSDISSSMGNGEFDPNLYRALHVKVQLSVEDIQAHLVKVHVLCMRGQC